MFEALKTRYLVPYDNSFRVGAADTTPPADAPDRKDCERMLEERIRVLRSLQRRMYAQDRWSVLLVFQAMDAAGKDGTIRAVMSGVNPAGCQVFSFKKPSAEELDHDFLWRCQIRNPERGRIGIFNRSYYEEVLVVRVHPQYLQRQRLPEPLDLDKLWSQRHESIRDHEKHLARNGTIILKFWLNVSRGEQKERFLKRISDQRRNWKFNAGDVAERAHWDSYMRAYEDALNATSREHAPWYVIPADDKPYMRLCVADTIVRTLESLKPEYPKLSRTATDQLQEMKRALEGEDY